MAFTTNPVGFFKKKHSNSYLLSFLDVPLLEVDGSLVIGSMGYKFPNFVPIKNKQVSYNPTHWSDHHWSILTSKGNIQTGQRIIANFHISQLIQFVTCYFIPHGWKEGQDSKHFSSGHGFSLSKKETLFSSQFKCLCNLFIYVLV